MARLIGTFNLELFHFFVTPYSPKPRRRQDNQATKYQRPVLFSQAHKVVRLFGMVPAAGGVAPIALLKLLAVLALGVSVRPAPLLPWSDGVCKIG